MKIWIDGFEANQVQRVGSGQYAFEILRNLERIDSDSIGIDQKNNYTILLPSQPLPDLPKTRLGWKYKILKFNKFKTWLAIPLTIHLAKDKPDVFFSPTHYIPRFTSVKRVCTIFDLSFLHFPEMFKKKDLWQLKLWTKFSLENANKILAISDFTKQDIVKNYGVDTKKIIVTPLGYDQEIFKPIKDKKKINATLVKYKINKPYIIFIGTIQPRKNLIKLMEAFKDSIVTLKNVNLKLVIVGKTTGEGREGWMFKDILETPKRLGIEDKIIFTGFVPTEELPVLLSGAKCFVLPSFWEGFGIPVLEAMACGIPVVVSNVSSLPEVAGQAGTLVDPYSVEDIVEKLKMLLEDEKLRQKKVQLGRKQLLKFSWEKCTRKTLKALMEVNDDKSS